MKKILNPKPPLETVSRRFGGLINRKERWGLSRRGWLTLTMIALLASMFVLFGLYPFLAVTHRVDTKILVVEGWVHEYAIIEAVKEFKNGGYERVFTTGGPVEGLGGYVNDFQTSASVGADLLRKNGITNNSLQMVPSHVATRDRTYGAALALRDWFRQHQLTVTNLNVLTEEAHSRRTRLLFQEALGPDIKVGIISVPSPDYDHKHWWRYSEGVREIFGESIGYIYAKFFFWPPKAKLAVTDR